MDGPLRGKRIGLVSGWASRLGGGVFEAVVAQSQLITAAGGQAHVFALEDCHSAADADRFGSVPVSTFRVAGPGQIGFAPRLLKGLHAARLDLVHLHGIWMFPSAIASAWARQTNRAYIISPHGMLDPWITSRGRLKKSLARIGYERASWRRANFLHALTRREAADIENESGRRDTVVIANAGPEASDRLLLPRSPEVVYLGRIHPKKNLIALVEGWKRAKLVDGARLTIAGWGEKANVAALKAAIEGAGPSVEFVGPLYGAAKQALLGNARFSILPSHSEGLPMAVLESWAAGTPGLLSTECNLPEGFVRGAALDCGHSPESIASSLELALGLDESEWLAMAHAALNLARGPFSATAIAAQWSEAYLRAIDQGSASSR